MSVHILQKKKQQGKKISMLTCYDFPSAQIISKSSVDCVLVGDSVAMTVHGLKSTVHATMEMMVLHTAAVARGLSNQFLVADLPFMAYRKSLEDTVENTKQLLQAGAHAVKLEGADDFSLQQIKHLVNSGVPVIGHIGLQPQSVLLLGGYKVQGKNTQQAQLLLEQAYKLQDAGCVAIVLECIPSALAFEITQALMIPTIGIGAGPDTDGQVLVWHDVLAIQPQFIPKFVKQYAEVGQDTLQAIQQFHDEVEQGIFPCENYAF